MSIIAYKCECDELCYAVFMKACYAYEELIEKKYGRKKYT